MILGLRGLATSPLAVCRIVVGITTPITPHNRGFTFFNEGTGSSLRELENLLNRAQSFADLEATHIVQNLKASSLPGEIEVGDHVDPHRFRRGTGWTCLDEAAILSTIRTVQLTLYSKIYKCHLHNANLRRKACNLV